MCGQIIERGADIILLARAARVFAGASTCTAEVEAQRGQPGKKRGFGSAINYLVMHGAAKHRVRVANQRHSAGGDVRIPFHQRFQRSIGSGYKCAIDFRKAPRRNQALGIRPSGVRGNSVLRLIHDATT